MSVRTARPHDLRLADLYAILRLRSEVFVVEQHCYYLDPDGQDLLPTTWHLWTSDNTGLTGYLRILDAPDEPAAGRPKIGRVVVPAARRGTGVGATLMAAAHEVTGARPVRLDAQAYLERWYERFGYRRTGPDFDDAGIAHVPMSRETNGLTSTP